MGNHSSSESGPTQEDYKAFVDDLLELQKFLNEKFVAGHLRSSVTEDEFDAEYLNALKIKLRQLHNVRRHVRSQRGSRAQNVPTTLMRLLDALEPQCQKAIDELTRLQDHHHKSQSASSSQVDPVVLADDDSPSDVHPSTVSGGKCLLLLNINKWPTALVFKQAIKIANAYELQTIHTRISK